MYRTKRFLQSVPLAATQLGVLSLCVVTSCDRDVIPPIPDKPNGGGDSVVTLPNSHPNIILMLADDMGYDDMSYRGNSAVQTPCLDSLAQMATRFESFYVHSVSAPTRASLLTGRHFLRTGVSGMHAGRDFLNLDEVTIADALSAAGYKTGMWGKWHSGTSNGYYPWQRGFDEAYMASLYHHSYNNGLYKGEYEGEQYHGTSLSFKKGEGVWTDAKMTDMAIDFMKRNKDEKFFAYIPFLTAHEGWDAPDEYVAPYLNKGQSKNFATLNGMLAHLDHQVGRVIRTVDSLGIADNTVIIFMSDNGPNYNKSLLSASEWTQRNPSGYKGSKSKNTENGIHSPLFVYWKGRTVAMENHSVLGVCDIFPTLCEIAGAALPMQGKPLDGASFCNIIAAPTVNDLSRTLYISHWAPFIDNKCYDKGALTPDVLAEIYPELQHIGIRRGDYKLLLNEYGEGQVAFWNLANDYKEQRNLANVGTNDEKTKAQAYKADLITWYKGILNDEGALTSTTFQIGDEDYQYSEIYCYAPMEHSSGLTNDSHELAGFNTAGETATYSVNVLRDGDYDLRIYMRSKAVGDEVFTISTNLGEVDNEAVFEKNSYNSKWCRVTLTSAVKSITIKLKKSTSKEFALKNLRLEYIGN